MCLPRHERHRSVWILWVIPGWDPVATLEPFHTCLKHLVIECRSVRLVQAVTPCTALAGKELPTRLVPNRNVYRLRVKRIRAKVQISQPKLDCAEASVREPPDALVLPNPWPHIAQAGSELRQNTLAAHSGLEGVCTGMQLQPVAG